MSIMVPDGALRLTPRRCPPRGCDPAWERPGARPEPTPHSAAVEALPPDQAASALQEMELMQEFNRLVRTDAAEPKM